jgi:hypothetical protein
MSEFMDGYAQSKKGGDAWVKWKVEDALSLHPNYINLLGYQSGDALEFLNKEKALFDHALREMGYRLVPLKITYPKEIKSKKDRGVLPFEITSQWVNRGVGKAARDFHMKLTLRGDAGGNLAHSSAMRTSTWLKGKTYDAKVQAEFPPLETGTYHLRFGLCDSIGDEPLQLPLKNRDADGTYELGTICVIAD